MKFVKNESAKLGAEGGKWLKQLVDAAIRKDRNYFSFMNNLRNLLTGDHWKNIRGVSKKQLKMVVNLAHAHVRTLVPTLFFQNPSVDCAPTAPQHAGKEESWNGIINNTLDKVGFAAETKQVVLDSAVYQEAVMKHVVNRPEESSSEAGDTGPTVWLSKGSPVHVRISPAQLVVDYAVKNRDVEAARFIAIRYKKFLHELKMHPIYGKNVKQDVVPSITPSTGNLVRQTEPDFEDWDETEHKSYEGVDEEMVTIYEVWIHQLASVDGKHQVYQKMCVLLEGQDEPIRELESWESVMGEGFNRYPVDRLVLLPVPDAPPSSELGIWQGMQIALDWLISRITKLVENDRQIYEVDVGKLKNAQKAKEQFEKGESREWIEVTEQGAITLIQPTFVGRDNYTLVNLMNQYIQQVSGIGQNRRGGSGIRTATEASLVDEGTKIKTDEKVDTVSKFLISVITKNTMMTRALVKESPGGTNWVYRIGGDMGSVKWVNFTAEDVEWLPEVRIRVNSFRKMDSLQEMQKYAGLINVALQLFGIYGPQIRVDLLYARMLESAGIYDYGKIVGDQDQQMMLATIELAGMMGGVDTPVLESHNHAAHLKVDEAFRQSQFGQQLLMAAPELADRLAQHDSMHQQWLMELQKKAAQVQMAQNPFAAAGSTGEANEQSQANQLTSGDRTAVQSVPGGNGEMA